MDERIVDRNDLKTEEHTNRTVVSTTAEENGSQIREPKIKPRKKISQKDAAWIAFCCVLVLLFVMAALFLNSVKKTGEEFGSVIGGFAGRAAGSFEGVTEEIPRGLQDGKAEGLSAKDTEADIASKIEEIGRLEVLTAKVSLADYHQIGDDYKAIYIYAADAVFTVDLKNAQIERQGGHVVITMDMPSMDLYIRDSETEKVVDWQKRFYSGRSEDGYKAYLNSRNEIEAKASEKIANYDILIELAKDSAEKQLQILTGAAGIQELDVEIVFVNGEK